MDNSGHDRSSLSHEKETIDKFIYHVYCINNNRWLVLGHDRNREMREVDIPRNPHTKKVVRDSIRY